MRLEKQLDGRTNTSCTLPKYTTTHVKNSVEINSIEDARALLNEAIDLSVLINQKV